MEREFDTEKAKAFLSEKEQKEKEQKEQERLLVLKKTQDILKEELANANVEVFLVGSVIVPYKFHSRSDVDIVVKNFDGDRFALWSKLERKIGRDVELIKYENCSFQEHVDKEGLKVI